MMKRYDDLAWSYEWQHNRNCIEAVPGKEIETIEKALENRNLYDIYLEGVATADKYRPINYNPNYIERIIKEHT